MCIYRHGSPVGLSPFFDHRGVEPVVLDPNQRFRAHETANTTSKYKDASGIAESQLPIRLANRSTPRSVLTTRRRTLTGIEDSSGDRNIKSACPYEKSHEPRHIYQSTTSE